jgi:hypothetical protein
MPKIPCARGRDKAVVPGAPAPGLDLTKAHKRRSKNDPQTGETATLVEVPNDWLCIDIDQALKSIGYEPEASFAEMLPAELRDTSFVLQYSSSMQHAATALTEIDPGTNRQAHAIKAHLWFMLQQPMTPTQAKAWLEPWFAETGLPFDASVYRPQSVIFTANPVLLANHGINL